MSFQYLTSYLQNKSSTRTMYVNAFEVIFHLVPEDYGKSCGETLMAVIHLLTLGCRQKLTKIFNHFELLFVSTEFSPVLSLSQIRNELMS